VAQTLILDTDEITPLGLSYMEFDGVNQYAIAAGGPAAVVMPGDGSGGTAPTISFTIMTWVRGTDPAADTVLTGSHFMSVQHGGIGANGALYNFMLRAFGQYRMATGRTRETPTIAAVQHSITAATLPGGTILDPTGWRLWASVYTPTTQRTRIAGETTTDQTLTDYNNRQGQWFALNAAVSGTDGGLVAGTAYQCDHRAPAIYLRALDGTELAAIEAAGPTYNHALAGAEGWWPGDGDTYPTWRNRGSAGSAWDLTLQNGSQAMIKKV
jgi:hypothetical protein